MGKRFLRSLTGTQGKATLKHIKALAEFDLQLRRR